MKFTAPRVARPAMLAAVMGALTGCHHCTVTPPPPELLYPHKPVANLPTPPKPPSDAEQKRLRALPVIEIHSHTFNALSLPLEQIARGRLREYVWPPILSDAIGEILVDAIVGRTLKNQNPRAFLRATPAVARRPGSIAQQLDITTESVEDGRATVGLTTQRTASGKLSTIAIGDELDKDENWIKFAEAVFGLKEPGETSRVSTKDTRFVSKIVAFLGTLMSHDEAVRTRAQAAFGPQVWLFVHHTMDMGKTYAQTPDGQRFRDFVGWQLDRARTLDREKVSQGKFLHFVAFNPFNAEMKKPAGGWKDSIALQRVKDAIKLGAWGVKYYPPAGYRASANAIPEKPTDPILAAQWTSRYGHLSKTDLDELSRALFDYCATECIPVFAHCSVGEFQAANCYGQNMAHPAYYRKILEDLKTDGKTLRLCLGHAGGPSFWFGSDDAALRSWGEQVYELCTRFPEVYCEVGILSEVLKDNLRAEFTQRLTALYSVAPNPERYPFQQKLLYGSDWFMPDAAGATTRFLDEYRNVFLSNEVLAKAYPDFFFRNALRYLRVREKLAAPSTSLPKDLRENLAKLVDAAK